ncbi:UDP-N-acetylmuramoyl-tripeptide--D-alanyl-D- alani ne ligase [Legionella birminghamensis]|uniref:UDP-N-acetylmuramoyl-tripeptide--D-alanyl-D-alanine ligase n=1 Tax=Legionella birminghamensis TaxID=28083 RepID=A0A378I5Z1_9GAMM|nr:UDP-N-acetylmuramoyl-tripeptide--D-alanyl-D-alanine ligase [Legionella birminghamensis]KTC72485.1 UDP-N-acetylmuramoyl-tripeptide--D-alanyl-D- alani ne ligase [Legionella birminghamensis]STX30617.1 UDP-N-acetylmuramoyl-tripeptide--D-alanyl-D-alanine ligase [Legionella birminghamensis]
MKLQEIAKVLGCSQRSGEVSRIVIDSRQVQPGDLFVALQGERFNGYEFILDAEAKGAVAVICEQNHPQVKIPQLLVRDSLAAMTELAKAHRQSIHCPVIALTGSNGKTTVKEMIASILPNPSLATYGNLNNHIGAPLSVLQLRNEHRYAVFELGANHPGEIAHTVAIVKPGIALINNIAPAHIEGFGSIDGVARAKGEIYEGLGETGTAVVNHDDNYAHFWDELLAGKKVIRFGLQAGDVFAREVTYDERGCPLFMLNLPNGSGNIHLHVPGEHSIRNALAAASCAYAAGIGLDVIVNGLNAFSGVKGRMTYLQGKNNSIVIDDTYNANLRSVLTAVDVLSKRQGKRILVLGDMGELGAWTQKHHEEIGLAALQQGIDLLMTCGRQSEFTSKAFGQTARHYSSQDELAQDLLPQLDSTTTVLVKGSRSAAMEKIVQQLVA